MTQVFEFGNNKWNVLLFVCGGKDAQAELGGKTCTSPPLIDSEEIFSEWRVLSEWSVFKRAFAKEKKALMEKKQLSKPPTIQEIKMEMESGDGYEDISPEIVKLLNFLLVLSVGTASVEPSFSYVTLVKTG